AFHNDKDFVLSSRLSVDRDGLIVLTPDTWVADVLARDAGTTDLYLELIPGRGREAAREFARRHGLPVVATNAVHFAHPQDHARHRLLAAIIRNATLTTVPGDALAPVSAWLKPAAEMARLFPDCPEALENTARVAEDCRGGPPDGRVILPTAGDEADALSQLRALVEGGARRRYGVEVLSPVVRERIEHELAIIATKRYAGYFLVVWDIARPAPPTRARAVAPHPTSSSCL